MKSATRLCGGSRPLCAGTPAPAVSPARMTSSSSSSQKWARTRPATGQSEAAAGEVGILSLNPVRTVYYEQPKLMRKWERPYLEHHWVMTVATTIWPISQPWPVSSKNCQRSSFHSSSTLSANNPRSNRAKWHWRCHFLLNRSSFARQTLLSKQLFHCTQRCSCLDRGKIIALLDTCIFQTENIDAMLCGQV